MCRFQLIVATVKSKTTVSKVPHIAVLTHEALKLVILEGIWSLLPARYAAQVSSAVLVAALRSLGLHTLMAQGNVLALIAAWTSA